MTDAAFGLHAIHARAIHREPSVAGRIGALLADRRWPSPMALVRPTPKPGAAAYPWPSGKVPHAKLAAITTEILVSNDTLGIHAVASRTDEHNHVYAHVDGGHADYTGRPQDTAYTFDVRLFCRAATDAWVDLAHELVMLVDAPNAVIFARPDERHVWSLLYGTGAGRSDAPADHPHNVNARVAGARRSLGDKLVRAPEWGTYLSAKHVDAVGRDKLVAAAAVTKDVGTLLYLQCSAHPAGALGPEARERRTALAALLAPISVGETGPIVNAGCGGPAFRLCDIAGRQPVRSTRDHISACRRAVVLGHRSRNHRPRTAPVICDGARDHARYMGRHAVAPRDIRAGSDPYVCRTGAVEASSERPGILGTRL